MASWWCFILIAAAVTSAKKPSDVSNEGRLMRDLFEGYDKAVRPVTDSKEKVTVRFGLALIDIVDFKDDGYGRGIITINTWERYLWQDYRLKWETAEYGGVSVIRAPHDKFWVPDIKRFKSGSHLIPEQDDVNHVVYSNGEILWTPPSQHTIFCHQDSNSQWQCPLEFLSWSNDGLKVDISGYGGKTDIDLDDYQGHPRFQVLDGSGRLNVMYYPCCVEPYPSMAYNLTIVERE